MSTKGSTVPPGPSAEGERTTAWASRLAALAQIAQVVAAAAVVVSLLYVGRELRATTAAIQGSSVQEVTLSASQSLLSAATDSSLSRILQVGARDPSALTEAERYRREVFVRQFWLIMQNAYLQNELGTIDARAWAVFHRIICDVWTTPGARESWKLHRHLMDEGFAVQVESCPRPGRTDGRG
ncbi:MAG TPA: hypothetical protein VKA44_03980 [Gemmatimonadota bacterium]|nr:hypothetical protein [Gemmatimonadota bacterium]